MPRTTSRWITIVALGVGVIAAGCVGRAFQPNPTPASIVVVATPATTTPDSTAAAPLPLPARILVDCFDANGDHRIDAKDAQSEALANPATRPPDLNLDGRIDGADLAIVAELDIPLDDAKPCSPTYGFQFSITPAASGPPACSGETPSFALIVGVIGAQDRSGSAPIDDPTNDDGNGVRSLVQELATKFAGLPSATIIAAPDVPTATEPHAAMESWLEAVLKGIFDTHACVRAVVVGHSHGTNTALDVAKRLEDGRYAKRIRYVGVIDRVTRDFRDGMKGIPRHTKVRHYYQNNGTSETCSVKVNGEPLPNLNGEPIDSIDAADNVLAKTSATGETLCHGTIDDDPSVHEWIASEANALMQNRAN